MALFSNRYMSKSNNNRNFDVKLNSKRRIFVHSPVTFEHNGITGKISTDGRITITAPVKNSDQFDEVEIPASMAYKIVTMLEATRKVKYVNADEFKPASEADKR